MSSGFASDADSVKTEDFESHFNNMMVNQGETSDPDMATNDPIHARVKQLLKATAKCEYIWTDRFDGDILCLISYTDYLLILFSSGKNGNVGTNSS